jgi:hypothetical protein
MSKPWRFVAHAAASLLIAGTAAASLAQDAQPPGSLSYHVVQVDSPRRPVVVVECDDYGRLVSQPCPPAEKLTGIQAKVGGLEVRDLHNRQLLPAAGR